MAVDFNGTTHRGTLPSASVGGDEGSVAMWAAPDFASTSTSEIGFFDMTTKRTFLYKTTGSGGVGFYFDGRERIFTGCTWTTSALTHFVGQWKKSTDTLELYINGALQSSSGISGVWGATAVNTFELASDSSGGRLFDGDMAELATYNRLLTANEITALSVGMSPLLVAPDARLGHWRLLADGRPYWGSTPITWIAQPPASLHPRIFVPGLPSFSQRTIAVGQPTIARYHSIPYGGAHGARLGGR